MFKSFFYRILQRRHFWRYATFSEISELYISKTIRTIAMSIVSGFTAVYLYQEGYSLAFIMGFFLCYYLVKIPLSFFAGSLVVRFGPKYCILLSNLLYIPSMISLGLMPNLGIASVVLWGVFMCLSTSIYLISYLVDFSKVKNVEHAGKEIAFMNIFENIAFGISPIIGGLIALWFGLQSVMWIAAFLFIFSALPLIWSVKFTDNHQKIKFVGFPWKTTISSIIAQVGIGFDYVTTELVWSLFIVIVIFPKVGWGIYVKLGVLSSVTILAAIFVSYIYGKLIDNKKGGDLLRISVIANAVVHITRPFVNSAMLIVGTNIVNQTAAVGYGMSFTRGVFDTADLSGNRILYLCVSGAVASLGSAVACLVLLLGSMFLGNINGLKIFFIAAAAFVLLIGTARFNIYRK